MTFKNLRFHIISQRDRFHASNSLKFLQPFKFHSVTKLRIGKCPFRIKFSRTSLIENSSDDILDFNITEN